MNNLIYFYDLGTSLVEEGKAVEVVYPDFSKAFDTTSHSILLQKLTAHGLDRYTLGWVRNWLNSFAQKVVMNGAKNPAGNWSRVVFPRVGIGACPLQYLY